jgi:hypothetical protein
MVKKKLNIVKKKIKPADDPAHENLIRELVKTTVATFACKFQRDHLRQVEDPDGVINMKIHNVFVAGLGEEIVFYSSLVRSFDSAFGNMIEKLAIDIAKLSYTVTNKVQGVLYSSQTSKIADLLQKYNNQENPTIPSIVHYQEIKDAKHGISAEKTHKSDYCLFDEETGIYYLIELKIGGDLDNKKARSEKEGLMEQFAILSNKNGDDVNIECYLATAYNKYGDGNPWNQGRVLRYFSEEELLIGRSFWNFICKSENGYDIVLDEYNRHSDKIKKALAEIKKTYLKKIIS